MMGWLRQIMARFHLPEPSGIRMMRERDVSALRRASRLTPGDKHLEAELRRAEDVIKGHQA